MSTLESTVRLDWPSVQEQPTSWGPAPEAATPLRVRPAWRGAAGVLAAVDLLAAAAAVGLSLTLANELGLAPATGWAVLGLLALPITLAMAGLYPGYGLEGAVRMQRRCLSTLGLCLALAGVAAGFGAGAAGLVLLASAVALALGCLGEEAARELMLRLGCWGRPVVVIASLTEAAEAAQQLRARPELGLRPVGVIGHEPALPTQAIGGLPLLGPLRGARRLARQVDAAVVVDAPPLGWFGRGRPPFHTVISWSTTEQSCAGPRVWCSPLARRRWWLVKRAMDVALGVPLLIVSLPILAIAGLWIRAASAGPAFYFQKRLGLGGRTIRVVKLRTMYQDADERLAAHLSCDPDAAAQWRRHMKLRRDPRVLPGVGQLLRRTSLDELPQLWNVVRGEMSLVGPRPLPTYHLEQYPPPFRALRRTVMPGITGLWQVEARSEGDVDTLARLDRRYILRWSIWLDLHLLVRTAFVVLGRRGAY